MRRFVFALGLFLASLSSATADVPCVSSRDYFVPIVEEAIAGANIQIVGDVLYAVGEGGFEIWDVSRPHRPQLLGARPDLTGNALFVDWPFVYLAGDELIILRASSPTTTVVLSRTPTAPLTDVVVRDDRAYVATLESLAILDISDKREPVLLGSASAPDGMDGSTGKIALAGSVVYQGFDELVIFDVSTDSPVFVDDIFFHPHDVLDVEVVGTTLFVVAGYGGPYSESSLTLYDVATPASPAQLSETRIFTFLPTNVTINDHYALIVSSSLLLVVNVSDPSNPTTPVSHAVPEGGVSVATSEAGVFTASEPGTLTAFRLESIETSTAIATTDFPARSIDVDGTLVASVDRAADRMQLFDFTDPLSPTTLGGIDLEFNAFGATLDGTLAYVVGIDNVNKTTMSIVDVSDPHAPVEIGLFTATFGGRGYVVAIDGDRAFVGTRHQDGSDDGAVIAVDVSDPTDPQRLWTTFVDRAVDGILAHGDRVCAATSAGLWVWEPTTTHFNMVMFLDVSALSGGLEIHDDLLIAGTTRGLTVLDLETLEVIAQTDEQAWAPSLAIDWPLVYRASPHHFHQFDYADPTNPRLLGTLFPGEPGFHYNDEMVIVSGAIVQANGRALVAYPPACRTSVGFSQSYSVTKIEVYPNPATDRMSISFDLPDAGLVRVDVFDVAGRHVRVVHEGWSARGNQDLEWDGLTIAGEHVPSGIYFVRLRTEGLIETRSVAITR